MHYILAYAGLAAVIPFLPVVARQIGISATALGIAYSVIPFISFLCNPIIGFLVDYFQNVKIFYIFLLISTTASYASILSLPTISRTAVNTTYIRIDHFNQSETLLNISKSFERTCLENILQNHAECKLVFEKENNVIYDNESRTSGNMINITYNEDAIEYINQTGGNSHWITFHVKDMLSFEAVNMTSSSGIHCSPPIQHCSVDETFDIFSAYQFWVFLTLLVTASIAGSSSNSLTYVACLELLGPNTEAYGRQRLFGTIAWGIACPLSGLLNDHFEESAIYIILLMAIFRTMDIIILCFIPIPKAHASSDMSGDLHLMFTSKEILMFSSGVVLTGFLNAIIYVFEFWFLEDLGATRTLLGLSIFMQCLVGEVPFLCISGSIVRKIGHFLSLTCVFVGFLMRLAFYFLLKDPWLVLLVDTLHGVTFGLYDVTMTSFAKEKAPKGMEATMLGIFHGLRSGLGYGLGSLLGGIGLDKLGPRPTFFSACMLSLGCSLFFLLASYIFKKESTVKSISQMSLETVEKLPTS